MAENAVTVRKLNTKDFWALLKIVKAGGKEAFSQLQEAKTNEQRAAVILDVGLDFAENQLTEFIADLAGLTKEQYLEGDFDLTLTVLEKAQEQNDFADFFKRAASFIKKFQGK